MAILMLAGLVLLQICYFNNPRSTLYVLITYCFLFGILMREVGGDIPYGTLIEVLLAFCWIVIIVKIPINEWAVVKTDLFYVLLGWFILSIIEVANPAGASVMGWLQEIRSAALYPFIIVPTAYILLNKNEHLNTFIKLIMLFSVLAALNGIKQLHFGLTSGEQRFLDEGAASTHVLFGKLRVFSFYSEAGQFGASQAQMSLMALILCLGPYKWWKRVLLFITFLLTFYGMLISGTRGALFALVVGGFVAIILSKHFKAMIQGGVVALFFICFLKFTSIGNGNYQIYRLRTALDPQDASLNVRLHTQQILSDYMSTLPFGGGLGVLGAAGNMYNQDKFLSTIQPDSYWVKIWAMYGVVGLTIWIGMMMFILGKCCGIVWRLKDPGLRIKCLALTAGFAGIFFCSYGNEVINTMPSSIVVYVSWVFVFIAPKLDRDILEMNNNKIIT